MKNKFVLIYFVTISILLSSCKLSISPNLLSIEFVDDRTIEYEFALVIGENASTGYYRVKYFSIIPDGVTVKLEFYDFDRNYVLTHRFVKGEESESL